MKLEKCHRKFIRELLKERKEKTSLEFERRWISEIEEWLDEEEM